MRFLIPGLLAALCACHATPDAAADGTGGGGEARPPETPLRPASAPPKVAEGTWDVNGGTLEYVDAGSEAVVMTLACAAGRLRVQLPRVPPSASDDRLTFGGGGDVEALVVDRASPALAAAGPSPKPERLAALLEAGPGASYGANAIGPLVPVPTDLARSFSAGCR